MASPLAPNVLITDLPRLKMPVEIVERKGIGHPDTICDALAEHLSRNLCKHYLEKFGAVLHHNVDKALLRGGSSDAHFGGGEITEPIEIYLAGRATTSIGSDRVPVEDIAVEGSRAWLKAHLHALDTDRHVRIHCLVRSGSADLRDVFQRAENEYAPLSNDTSIGVGYAPISPLERAVKRAEQHVTDHDRADVSPAWGEDVKLMGITSPEGTQLTVATAMVSSFVGNAAAYEMERSALSTSVLKIAESAGLSNPDVTVNAADDPASGSYYLTVTGTSAESGDDGQIGRGNRVNGLITPYRPMTLEAAAGKNPVNHVGKLYNVAAQQIAESVVDRCGAVLAAHCYLVSRIGRPITQPAFIDIRVQAADDTLATEFKPLVQQIVLERIERLPDLMDSLVDGLIDVF